MGIKNSLVVIVTAVLLLLPAHSVLGQDVDPEAVVIFKENITLAEIEQFLRDYDLESIKGFRIYSSEQPCLLVRGKYFSVDELCNKLKKDQRVFSCFPNVNIKLQSDQQFGWQDVVHNLLGWNTAAGYHWFKEATDYMDSFLKLSGMAPREVTIVYLDSGFLSPEHPFIRQLTDRGVLYDLNIDGQQGYGLDVVDSKSKSYSSEDLSKALKQNRYTYEDLNPEDTQGHGTYGAFLGLAFAPGCRILPVKFNNSQGAGQMFDLLMALNQISRLVSELTRDGQASGRIVLNMSIRTDPLSEDDSSLIGKLFFEPLYEQGVVMLAAGNNPGQSGPAYPASSDKVIGIVAEGNDHSGADAVAPGKAWAVGWPLSLLSREEKDSSSCATFMASALIARILQIAPDLSPAETKTILCAESIEAGLAALIKGEKSAELGPHKIDKIDALTATRLALVYSGYQDISLGIHSSNIELIEQGRAKLLFDQKTFGLSQEVPSLSLDSDISVVEDYLFIQYRAQPQGTGLLHRPTVEAPKSISPCPIPTDLTFKSPYDNIFM